MTSWPPRSMVCSHNPCNEQWTKKLIVTSKQITLTPDSCSILGPSSAATVQAAFNTFHHMTLLSTHEQESYICSSPFLVCWPISCSGLQGASYVWECRACRGWKCFTTRIQTWRILHMMQQMSDSSRFILEGKKKSLALRHPFLNQPTKNWSQDVRKVNVKWFSSP